MNYYIEIQHIGEESWADSIVASNGDIEKVTSDLIAHGWAPIPNSSGRRFLKQHKHGHDMNATIISFRNLDEF